jgi:small subunit ribosomal protein S8
MSVIATDPIADMLTRIRNAIAVNKTEVSLPHSEVKEKIARILASSGFLSDVSVEQEEQYKNLHLVLNPEGTNSAITEIDRLSKPGRRVYSKAGEIPAVKRGRGVVVISTSKGIMTGEQARTQGLGGELICKVY